MALTLYKKKRSFKDTPEPTGGKAAGAGLRFVVQKHDATRLHYDFRLEMEGVLKSWAVPKGPSMNPEDKRLAMMVEDHPYGYKDFEGNIPKGNYGAGNVIVWDNGTYEPIDLANKEDAEKKLRAGLHKGHISFILHGSKLKGEFSLIKLKGKQENAWLLIKKDDKYASETDILKKNKSVISGVTLEQLENKSIKKKSTPKQQKQAIKPAKQLSEGKHKPEF